MRFETAARNYAEEPLTRQLILNMLREYKRPNDKVNELMKQGKLLAVKRGLYVPGPELGIAGPEPFLVANHLWGPSYVSLESALSHWGLIPERVYEVSSVTLKSSKNFKTPSGRFQYIHASMPYYAFGIKSLQLTPRQTVLIASPEKALCDKIVVTSGIALRSIRQTQDFLLEDLRINEESLHQLDLAVIHAWKEDAPKKSSLEMLIKTIEVL
ncbi:hypothetical protein [Parasegetibacter sp. NRK P23]|uniref:type IV toxin-antitoxin system AbiEi family antitoxin domain-containing protein n=1 Tax=Parasegetibacter sp. NRK P23 TaxID=2942999 RepID=UPI0020435F5B|nr:hypothetical protein [Parasegetibacter sp. NRK P23]MCM5527731.1 hypothetical protein [Parasegetibacter sp. NRK P23]